jgi:hypothetical protein
MVEQERYVVIVKDTDVGIDGERTHYVLATRQVFGTEAEAETYAHTCATSRDPLVVAGRWFSLRHASVLPKEDRS